MLISMMLRRKESQKTRICTLVCSGNDLINFAYEGILVTFGPSI